MSFGWMIVTPSAEEESFETEDGAIDYLSTEDVAELQGLCVSLTRQNRQTALLLQQAVGRIAQMMLGAPRRLTPRRSALIAANSLV